MPAKYSTSEETKPKIFLVFVNNNSEDDSYTEQELEGLVDAAGGTVCGTARQRLERPYKSHYIGSGKVIEIKESVEELEGDLVVFDCELSGIQIRNLEEKIGKPILDRTQLILDIFASRAFTREGMLQVELAQYTYRLPRLMSVYTKFERQRGGIGMRGPGETKLESDRRMVRDRIARLKTDIEVVRRQRDLQRAGRRDQPYPVIAIVGYTSAGKSTLMNLIAKTDVLVDAMPFATLDPTTRLIDLPDGDRFFLVDTVGFIRKLPTMLVAAFRATLEESAYADLLLHIVDVSNEEWEMQSDAVIETLESIGAQDVQILTVFNKIDIAPESIQARKLVAEWPDSVAISALTGEGLDDLFTAIRRMLADRLGRIKVLVPYADANLAERTHDFGRVIKKEYRDDGIYIEAELVAEMRNKLEKYIVAELG